MNTFDPSVFHRAMDEAYYDAVAVCPRCRAAGFKASDFLVNAVTRVHDLLAARGVRTWVWADNFDLGQNGSPFDLSGTEILARLPRDVVMNDWKYSGTTDPSVGLFTGAGFPTVVSSWQTPWNVADLIAAAADAGASGYVGASWNDTSPAHLPPERVCNVSLGAYLFGSPGAAHLRTFLFVLAALYQTAAYGRRRPPPVATLYPPPPTAVAGATRAERLLWPPGGLGFLETPAASPRGVPLLPFRRDGQFVGLAVAGGSTRAVTVPLSGGARFITALHTVNRQPVQDHMHARARKFKDATAGAYVLRYADGSRSDRVTLRFRRDITSWNDRHAPAEALPALFGTVEERLRVNIGCLTIVNPYPDKPLQALDIEPGNHAGLDLALLGIAVEP